MLAADHLVAGRYRLRHEIARGGMAEVWEAEDSVLGRAVAVKLLLPELAADPSFLERFRREAIAAARLAHPNVVGIFDTGIDDGLAFIVMELVDGTTLRETLLARGALPPAEAIDIAAQVAGALEYAHKAGIVHRDVKPANILLCADGRVKVADFGIAKAAATEGVASNDLTGTGAVVGTAKYLSPEQVDGRPVDGRTDVYALGVVLYEMLCGRPPFSGDTEMAIGIQHLDRKPLSPRQVKAGIPKPLEAIVLRALAKAPDDRYANAAAMQTALLSVDLRTDDAVPMIVRDDTPPRGTPQTFAQSQRSWIVPTAVIVLVAVALGIVGILFARSDAGQRLLGKTPNDGGATVGNTVTIASVTSFDPDGDGSEHEEEVSNLIDGDPATTWSTSRYGGPGFGGLKPGVGFVLELDQARDLGELKVLGAGKGWSAEVAVSDTVHDNRADWGPAVDSQAGIDGSATFDLGGTNGSAILVWITDQGADNSSVSIGEVEVTGA
ncbi:MAG: eukaryotic-like serine/threonine-protein kinase [Actinomycetota bacterium]|nr:eukaryotic-like serine/threonine-protein kinase [Actinomycetota bacterium]